MASSQILLVEDDDAIRLTLRDYLERKGHTVFVSSDGVGAIKILVDRDVDVIITDFRMAQIGGDYWMRFLQKFCPNTRVFVMSGYVEPTTEVPFRTFTKPFDYGELERAVREALAGGA